MLPMPMPSTALHPPGAWVDRAGCWGVATAFRPKRLRSSMVIRYTVRNSTVCMKALWYTRWLRSWPPHWPRWNALPPAPITLALPVATLSRRFARQLMLLSQWVYQAHRVCGFSDRQRPGRLAPLRWPLSCGHSRWRKRYRRSGMSTARCAAPCRLIPKGPQCCQCRLALTLAMLLSPLIWWKPVYPHPRIYWKDPTVTYSCSNQTATSHH